MWARLILNCGGVDLVAHELVADVITVGRASLNHVVIDDPTVSAQHAMLMRLGRSYQLRDLRSTNGTQVNGVLITEAELKDGDKIRFGSAVAIFAECFRKS
jgi:pSer/pThr/pTyr-binding forkhead associated (FHA) protein